VGGQPGRMSYPDYFSGWWGGGMKGCPRLNVGSRRMPGVSPVGVGGGGAIVDF
jgi:hypothetical protein